MKKIELLICVLIIGGIGLFAATFAMLTPQGTIHKAIAYKGYKTYKNKELGFSFKYPKNWYFNIIDRFALLGELTNFNPNKGVEGIPLNEIVEIKIKMFQMLDKDLREESALEKYINDNNNPKPIKELIVDGGKIYLLMRNNDLVNSREGTTAYFYVLDIKSDNGQKWDYLVEFFPNNLSKKYGTEYLKLIKSIKINK